MAAGDEAKNFLSAKLKGTSNAHLIAPALAAIDHFSAQAGMAARIVALRAALSNEEAGLGTARTLNRQWLEQLFKSRVQARAEFGQPLAPLDPAGLTAIQRPKQSELMSAFCGRPAGELYVVVGEEGVGKSWICANTWVHAAPRSMLLICTADELLDEEATSDFDEFLIRRLIRQTSGSMSERAVERWRRRLKGWRANPSPDNVRVTLLIDGLNQPRKGDWARWIDRAAVALGLVGGCVVVTTRSAHWASIQQSLVSPVKVVTIVPWTIAEVKSLLADRGIDAEKVQSAMLHSLRNPRVLGLAIDLLDNKDVERIGQLSVSRLMFEQVRRASVTGAVPFQPIEFVELMKQLASEIIGRLRSASSDDLLIFDEAGREELQAAATTQFFEPVPGSSREYEIKAEGLNIGLALYLISALSKEHRNKRNPRDILAAILEPIAALDEVAKVVFTAVQIACLKDDTETEVKAALLEHFVSLQNPPADEADAFALLVKKSPAAFLVAMENVHCSRRHYSNAEWLLYALMHYGDVPAVWDEIESSAKRWLSFYSLAPERMMFKTPGRDPVEQVDEERAKRLKKISESTAVLTETERTYIKDNLVEAERWDFHSLLNATFYVLAGKTLANFAPFFMRHCFSYSYSPSIQDVSKAFRQLIRFNRIDWAATRDAFLAELERLPEADCSYVGKWARVEMLRATGALDDSVKAEALAEWLNRDRERIPGWSLREKYCAVDPCDPTSDKPDNVDATAQTYRNIDPAKLLTQMGQAEGDHFFGQARCGVARFHLADAVVPHRGLADDVLARTGFARRQGVLGLLEHSSLLTLPQARGFLSAGQSSTASYKQDEADGRDEWLTAQNSIRLAIPHLLPDEQLEAVSDTRSDLFILNTIEQIRPATEEKVEAVLERVIKTGSETALAAVLAAMIYSKPPMSDRAIAIVADLCSSDKAMVRTHALGVAAAYGDASLLSAAVATNWDARKLVSNNTTFEAWYGSSAILVAAKAGLLPINDALDRMHLNHYGFAAIDLGPSGATAVVPRVDAAIRMALGYDHATELPGMTTTSPRFGDAKPPLMSLEDPPAQGRDEQLDRLSETTAAFNERQKRIGRAYETFARKLSAADADLILADLTSQGIKALADADRGAAKAWLSMLYSADDAKLRRLHHVAFQLAIALSRTGDATALALVRRVADLKPTIRRITGAVKLPMEALLLWENADVDSIELVCRQRLISRHHDADIACEVLAASLSGRAHIVEQVVDELLQRGEPLDCCLALMLSGFSDSSSHASAVLARFQDASGFVGQAHDAAKAAYERNAWSKDWHQRMRDAKDQESFWQASVMLSKIVDGRFDLWSTGTNGGSSIFEAFKLTVRSALERRIGKWQTEREKKLFGDAAPPSIFLS